MVKIRGLGNWKMLPKLYTRGGSGAEGVMTAMQKGYFFLEGLPFFMIMI